MPVKCVLVFDIIDNSQNLYREHPSHRTVHGHGPRPTAWRHGIVMRRPSSARRDDNIYITVRVTVSVSLSARVLILYSVELCYTGGCGAHGPLIIPNIQMIIC